MSERQFPILHSYLTPEEKASMPWAFVAPHERQALRNHSQTLERLAERGGLGWSELELILRGHEWDGKIFILPKDRERYIASEAAAKSRVEALLKIWRAHTEQARDS